MEKIRFLKDYAVYDGSVSLGNNIVTIRFNDSIPPQSILANGFVLLNENNNFVQGHFDSYKTVYRVFEDDPYKISFSCDESIYEKPIPTVTFSVGVGGNLTGQLSQVATSYENLVVPTPIASENYVFLGWRPDIKTSGVIEKNEIYIAEFQYIPPLDEIKASKLQEISNACEQVIYTGIDVEISGNAEHFSLTEKDQLNLFGKQVQLASGVQQLEYHQDKHPCRYYTAEEMQKIIVAALFHVTYHTTYCNSLNMWIAGATSKDEISSIYYGSTIPEKYQSEVLKDYIQKMTVQETTEQSANS